MGRPRSVAPAGPGRRQVDDRARNRSSGSRSARISPAAEGRLPLAHMALAVVIAHAGVSSAILGPRTMEQLDDLLAAAGVALTDGMLGSRTAGSVTGVAPAPLAR